MKFSSFSSKIIKLITNNSDIFLKFHKFLYSGRQIPYFPIMFLDFIKQIIHLLLQQLRQVLLNLIQTLLSTILNLILQLPIIKYHQPKFLLRFNSLKLFMFHLKIQNTLLKHLIISHPKLLYIKLNILLIPLQKRHQKLTISLHKIETLRQLLPNPLKIHLKYLIILYNRHQIDRLSLHTFISHLDVGFEFF